MRYMILLLLLAISFSAEAANRLITLRTDNTVLLRGEISQASINEAQLKLIKLVNNRVSSEPIYLVLDSPGGSIDAGEEFIQFAKVIANVETITLFSASMASAIAEALPGKRLITDNGTLMFHRASGGFQGQFETGEVESRLLYAKQIVLSLEMRNAARMNLSLPLYKDLVKDEYWAYGKYAVTANAADETVDLVCSRNLIRQRVRSSITFLGLFTVDTESSGCPLLKEITPVKATPEEKRALSKYLKTYTRSGVFR